MARTKFPSSEQNVLLSVDDLMLLLGVSRSWITKAMDDGQFPPARAIGVSQKELDELRASANPGGRWRSVMLRWYLRDIEEWLGEHAWVPEPPRNSHKKRLVNRVWKAPEIERGDEALLSTEEVMWFLNISGPTAAARLRDEEGFPKPLLLFPGGKMRRWRMSDIMAWLDTRPTWSPKEYRRRFLKRED